MEQILYSDVESKRFNANIYRCKTNSFNWNSLNEQIINHKVDVLILRLPTSTKAEHYKLLYLPYPILHADNLVYYKCDLSKINNKTLRDDLSFMRLNKNDTDCIKSIVPLIFENYQNHYFSNPLFDKDKITDGYVEWALNFLTDSEKICWGILNTEKEIVALACCTLYSDQNSCEINLAGTVPQFSKQGIYSFLIQQVQSFLISNDYKEVFISTQIQNSTVQKLWAKSGFNLAYSLDTYHINSKLGNWVLK